MSLRLEHSNPEAVVQAMQREREREREALLLLPVPHSCMAPKGAGQGGHVKDNTIQASNLWPFLKEPLLIPMGRI